MKFVNNFSKEGEGFIMCCKFFSAIKAIIASL